MVLLKASLVFYLITCVATIHGHAPDPRAIPLSKRNNLLAASRRDGFLMHADAFKAEIARTESKIKTGLAAIERNTGNVHPASQGFQGSFATTNKRAPLEISNSVSRRATAAEPLTDASEDLWFGTITVGTPPQTFTVDIDTGSSDTFLPAVGCDSTCDGHTLWNTAADSTAVNTTEAYLLEFGSGNATGFIFTDTVTIAGLTARNQAVGASNQYSVQFEAANFPPDGLVGMAFPSLSVFNDSPLFSTLVQQGTVAPVFGVNLADNGSELFLGGVDPTKFSGSFRNVSLIEENFYGLNLQAIDVNNETVATATGVTAIVDTGTTLLIGDPEGVQILYDAIPGAKSAANTVGEGFFTVPCNRVPTVGVTLGGSVFNVAPSIFNLGVLEGNECVGGVVFSEGIPFWVLGDIFLRNFYAVFDQGNSRVGFAAQK